MSRHISTVRVGSVENGVEIEVVAPSATAFLLTGTHGKPKGHSGNGLYVQGRGLYVYQAPRGQIRKVDDGYEKGGCKLWLTYYME